jgi:hypothetical protein
VSGPFTPAHKCHRSFSDGAHQCRHHVVLGVVATDIGGPRSHAEAEEVSWEPTNRATLPSTVSCVSNDEDSLPTPEIHLHITIIVVGCLKMAHEMRLLSVKELLLVDFLLD